MVWGIFVAWGENSKIPRNFDQLSEKQCTLEKKWNEGCVWKKKKWNEGCVYFVLSIWLRLLTLTLQLCTTVAYATTFCRSKSLFNIQTRIIYDNGNISFEESEEKSRDFWFGLQTTQAGRQTNRPTNRKQTRQSRRQKDRRTERSDRENPGLAFDLLTKSKTERHGNCVRWSRPNSEDALIRMGRGQGKTTIARNKRRRVSNIILLEKEERWKKKRKRKKKRKTFAPRLYSKHDGQI